jgi:hypothetical protein
MTEWQTKTPVALIIFNRPSTTEKVFAAIRAAKPPKLFLIADAPRKDRPDDVEKCAATKAIVEQVDWDCEVFKNYAETNLGCGLRPASGIDWVFEQVEEAIILEDDCLPHPSFFRYCDELLEYYRDNPRIMTICGLNIQFGRRRTQDSYYFSRFNHCWGWASWRRAWKHFDYHMKLWPEVKEGNWLMDLLEDDYSVKIWTDVFNVTAADRLNGCWDFQWTFSAWLEGGLAVLPNVNLISNIGHHAEGTHTLSENNDYSDMTTEAMPFPLIHPRFIIRDRQADLFTQNTYYDYHPGFAKKVKKRLYRLLKKSLVKQ